MTSNQSDAELVRQFQAGEPEAFAEVSRWIERVGSSFRHRLGASWEDVVQDVLLELSRSDLSNVLSFRAYSRTVMINACIRRYQRQQVRNRISSLDEALAEAGLEPVAPAVDRLSLDTMQRVWERASLPCRRLWSLIVQGFRYDEMAELEGESAGALRVRAKRCRDRAKAERRRLEQKGQDG